MPAAPGSWGAVTALAALATLAAALFAPALARASTRPWAALCLASLAGCVGLSALPSMLWDGAPGGLGSALAMLAGTLCLAVWFVRRLGLSRHELGLCLPATGSWRPALLVLAAALVLQTLSLWVVPGRPAAAPPVATWLYQALVPGLSEEPLFRGLLLALADRACPARRLVAGAPLGAGGLAVSLLFVALHVAGGAGAAGVLLGVLPVALLTLWLRARTGSLLLPVLAHNACNLLVLAAAR
jgi:hypothetical protein